MATEKTNLQNKHSEQMQNSRQRVLERKRRNHRLIVRGAIAERSIPDSEQMTDKEFEQNLFRIVEAGKQYLSFQQDYLENSLRQSPSEDSHGSDPR